MRDFHARHMFNNVLDLSVLFSGERDLRSARAPWGILISRLSVRKCRAAAFKVTSPRGRKAWDRKLEQVGIIKAAFSSQNSLSFKFFTEIVFI